MDNGFGDLFKKDLHLLPSKPAVKRKLNKLDNPLKKKKIKNDSKIVVTLQDPDSKIVKNPELSQNKLHVEVSTPPSEDNPPEDNDPDLIITEKTVETVENIFKKCYNKTMLKCDKSLLTQAEAWSEDVYGELQYSLVEEMIDKLKQPPHNIKFSKLDTFLDLGSGIGQVPLQVAATTNIGKSYGIEKCDYRAKQATEFKKRLVKNVRINDIEPMSKCKLFQGDFLGKRGKKLIRKSNIILANNFIFGAKLNHELVTLFQEFCEDGTKIITSKKLAIGGELNARNAMTFEAIVDVEELCSGSVSWTSNKICLYVHTINYRKLENYMKTL